MLLIFNLLGSFLNDCSNLDLIFAFQRLENLFDCVKLEKKFDLFLQYSSFITTFVITVLIILCKLF